MFRSIAVSMVMATIRLCAAAADAPQADLPDTQTIASAVRTQEELLVNLQVAAHRNSEQWDEATGEWNYSGESDLRVWLTGEPGSKVRIDYDRQVTRWIDGPAPFGEDSYRIAFNGQVTKRLQTRIGVAGAPSAVLTGELTAGASAEVEANGGTESGWRFCALGASPNEKQGIRFSEYLSLLPQGRMRTEVFSAETPQGQAVGLRVEEPNGQQRIFYFDPGRAFALVAEEFRFPNGALGSRWTVAELQCVAPGLYFPTQVVRELFTGHGRPRERSTFSASQIIANDPAWTDEVFDPPWPPGTVINDKIAGTVYRARTAARAP